MLLKYYIHSLLTVDWKTITYMVNLITLRSAVCQTTGIINYNLKELQSSHNDSDERLMLLSLIQKYSLQTAEPQLKWWHDKDFIANRF